MNFPVCITVDGTHVIACVDEQFKFYTTVGNILTFETPLKAFLADGKPVKKVKVFDNGKNSRFLGISMIDSRGSMYMSYSNISMIDIDSEDVDLSTAQSFVESIRKCNPDILNIELISNILSKISKELYAESQSLFNGRKLHPIVSTADMGVVYSASDWFNEENNTIHCTPSRTEEPDQRVFLPIPSTADIVRANKQDFKESDFMVELPAEVTYEFGSNSEIEDIIDSTVRLSLCDLVERKPSRFINHYYPVRKIFNKSSLTPDEKRDRIELAEYTFNSIYKQNNYSTLGINMEPNSEHYKMIFGQPDYNTERFPNEIEFFMALYTLSTSVAMYERGYFSAMQMEDECGGYVCSEWFDNYISEQIKYVLIDFYASSGQVISYTSQDEDDEDDFETSEEDNIEMSLSVAPQLVKIIKAYDGSFSIKQATPEEQDSKVNNHELEMSAGYDSIIWFARDSGAPLALIEVLIQLLRFGEHKYQYITVQNCDDKCNYPFFDTKYLKPVKMLNVEKPYTTVYSEKGKEYSIAGGVFLTDPRHNLNVTLPIGVVIKKVESNGVSERTRYVIYDTMRFINLLFAEKDGTQYLSIEEVDYKDGSFVFNAKEINDKIYSTRYSASELESARLSEDNITIIDPRVSPKQGNNIAVFCKKAGLDVPPVSSKIYTFMSAYAKLDTMELEYNPSEIISLNTSTPEQYVYKSIIKTYISPIMKNQLSISQSSNNVTLEPLIEFAYSSLNKQSAKDTDSATGLFDKMLTDTTSYKIKYHAIVKNDSQNLVGYAYQVVEVSTNKNYLLVASAEEIGLRLPNNPTGSFKVLPLSKLLSRHSIMDFYSSDDLIKQMDIVKSECNIVLASINTVKELRS